MTDTISTMGEGSVGRLLVRFSLPTIAMMAVNGLYNVIDRIYIGQGIGTLGIAAVTLTFPLALVAVAVGGMIGAGASTLISIALGADRVREARSLLGQAFAVSLAASVVLIAAGQLVMEPALRLLGATNELLPASREYLAVILVGFLFQIPSMAIGGSLRSQGRPRASVISVATGIAVNAALAPLFIFALHWGLAGAAWATVIAQATVFAMTIALTQNRGSQLKVEAWALRPSLRDLKRMAAIGFPVAAQNLIQIAVFGVANASVASYGGGVGIAMVGIVTSIYLLASLPVEGIGMGAQALWGYNWGAKRLDRVRSVTAHALAWSIGMSALFTAAIELFPRTFVAFFNGSDPELVELGSRGLSIFFLAFFLFGLSWVAAQFFQSVGRPAETTALLLGRNLLLIAAMILLSRLLGLEGVMWAGPASDLLTAIASAVLLIVGTRRLTRRRPPDRSSGAGGVAGRAHRAR